MRYILTTTAALFLVFSIPTVADATTTSLQMHNQQSATSAVVSTTTRTASTSSNTATTSLPTYFATSSLSDAVLQVADVIEFSWQNNEIKDEAAYYRLRENIQNTVDFAKKYEKKKSKRSGIFAWITNWRKNVLRQIVIDRMNYLKSRIKNFEKEEKIEPKAAERLFKHIAHVRKMMRD